MGNILKWFKSLFTAKADPKTICLNPARHPGYFVKAEQMRMKSHTIAGCNTRCDFDTLRHWIQS